MKNLLTRLLSDGLLVIVIVLVVWLVIAQNCQKKEDCPPEGYVLVDTGAWNKINALAEQPPDTFIKIIIDRGDPIYVDRPIPIPTPVEGSENTRAYSDSIVNDSISVRVDLLVEGFILDWDWKYDPIIIRKETTIEIPVPQIVDRNVPIDMHEFYLVPAAKFGSAVGVGASFMYLHPKGRLYGLGVEYYEGEMFYRVAIGFRLFRF